MKLRKSKKPKKPKVKKLHGLGALFGSPAKIWNLFLVFFVAVNVGAIVWSLYLFLEIDADGTFLAGETQRGDTDSLDKADLVEAIDNIKLRAENFDRILEENKDIVDPSL